MDLQPLNKFCKREEWVTNAPAKQASNRRFNAILEDFRDKERCVDDTIFWDGDLEKHW